MIQIIQYNTKIEIISKSTEKSYIGTNIFDVIIIKTAEKLTSI